MALDVVKLRNLMLEKEINQADIANKTNLNKATLSKILSGKVERPNIKTVGKICNCLGICVEEIMKEET